MMAIGQRRRNVSFQPATFTLFTSHTSIKRWAETDYTALIVEVHTKGRKAAYMEGMRAKYPVKNMLNQRVCKNHQFSKR